MNDDLFNPQSKLNNIINVSKLNQLITKATRITPISSTLLDVVITNNTDIVVHTDVIPCNVADHELLTLTVNLTKPKIAPVTRTFRCRKHYSPEILCNALLDNQAHLNTLMNTDDVNVQVDHFTHVFKTCLDSCAPIITQEIKRPPAPWLTQEIKEAMKSRDQLHSLIKNSNDPILREHFKNEKKRVKNIVQKSKHDFIREAFKKCNGNTKNMWKTTRLVLPTKNSDHLAHLNPDEIKLKAEEFNDYFASVGENTFRKTQELIGDNSNINNDVEGDIFPILDNSYDNFFSPSPVDIDTVILTVKDLNNTNSYGSDGIQLSYIKDSLPIIAFYITIIINTSIVTKKYPHSWKHPHVIPLFKAGDRDDKSNYRPISLLPILSKT
ncbi:MAG: hypothetical protein AAGK97_15635, partial [Bacteroidota bacterium]